VEVQSICSKNIKTHGKNQQKVKLIKMNKKEPLKITTEKTNKKIFFGENGEVVDKPVINSDESQNNKIKKSKKYNARNDTGKDIETKWYQIYDEYNTKELMEIKESEFKTFEEHCKKCFTETVEKLEKSKLINNF
jgi:hypothetical protein